MPFEVTDVWFRSGLSLKEIASRLMLQNIVEDSEDYWAWVIGTFGQVRLDLTRTHQKPASQVDTRIFIWDGGRVFTEPLLTGLVSHLHKFVATPIWCGRWVYQSGNEFELVITQEFAPKMIGEHS